MFGLSYNVSIRIVTHNFYHLVHFLFNKKYAIISLNVLSLRIEMSKQEQNIYDEENRKKKQKNKIMKH